MNSIYVLLILSATLSFVPADGRQFVYTLLVSFNDKYCSSQADQLIIMGPDPECKGGSPGCHANGGDKSNLVVCNSTIDNFNKKLQDLGKNQYFRIITAYSKPELCGNKDSIMFIQANLVNSCDNFNTSLNNCNGQRTEQCLLIEPDAPVGPGDPISAPVSNQNSDPNGLSHLEKATIGTTVSGWALAGLFFVLYAIKRKQMLTNQYAPLGRLENDNDSNNNTNNTPWFLNNPFFATNPVKLVNQPPIIQNNTNANKTNKRDANVNKKNEILQIDEKDVEWKNPPLGTGRTSTVYEGRWCNKRVAIKVPLQNRKDFDTNFLQEIRTIQKIDPHPNVIQIYGHFIKEERLHIVLELCDKKDLEELVTEADLPIYDKFTIAQGIAHGMAHLYTKAEEVVHRDLKPSNILLVTKGKLRVPKISDFGCARVIEQKTDGQTITTGSIDWAAPESTVDGPSKRYSQFSDVWMYGATLYFILTRERPVKARDGRVDFSKINIDTRNRFLYFLIHVCKICMIVDPSKRPTFAQICAQFADFYNEGVGNVSNNNNSF